MRRREAWLALIVLPILVGGVTLAAPPAAAEHGLDEDGVSPPAGWPGDAFEDGLVDDGRVAIDGDFPDTLTYECDFGQGITVGDCERDDDTTLLATVTIEDGEGDEEAAEAGLRDVTVTATDEDDESHEETCEGCFTVNGPTEVDPGEGEQEEQSLPITILGNGFDDEFDGEQAQGVECLFLDEEEEDETITFEEECGFADEEDERVVTATISITEEANTGSRDVRVDLFANEEPEEDEDPLAGAACFGCFTVTAASEDDPDPTPTPTPEDDFDDEVLAATEEDESTPAPRLPATGPGDPLPATGGGLTTAVVLVGTVALAAGLVTRRWRRQDMTEDS